MATKSPAKLKSKRGQRCVIVITTRSPNGAVVDQATLAAEAAEVRQPELPPGYKREISVFENGRRIRTMKNSPAAGLLKISAGAAGGVELAQSPLEAAKKTLSPVGDRVSAPLSLPSRPPLRRRSKLNRA